VHGATGAPYWPILACGMRVQVKTRYFEKFEINISTCSIQNETSYIKALGYKEYFTAIDLGKC
jgi:hypothetical protein